LLRAALRAQQEVRSAGPYRSGDEDNDHDDNKHDTTPPPPIFARRALADRDRLPRARRWRRREGRQAYLRLLWPCRTLLGERLRLARVRLSIRKPLVLRVGLTSVLEHAG